MTPTSIRRDLVFPACVLATVLLALWRPGFFGVWGGFDLRRLIVPCIQVIMFGMGATLGVADFARVARMPAPVGLGLALQFSVMPLLGWAIARALRLEPETAAGVILVGSVAGGVASNVAACLAGGNVPLSVSMTLCSTLASPFATPLLMRALAGRLVPIEAGPMMLSIAGMIVLPVFVGLTANALLFARRPWNRRAGPLWALAGGAAGIAVLALRAGGPATGVLGELRLGAALGAAFLALLALLKWWFEVRRAGGAGWLGRGLPGLCMAGICLIIGIITARAREQLPAAGPALLAAGVLHHLAGCLLGYWAARLARLDERDCRTVSLEVGMQNAGMAAGLAMNVLHSPAAALAAVIFGPWMNLSAALLACWWRRHPPPPVPDGRRAARELRGA